MPDNTISLLALRPDVLAALFYDPRATRAKISGPQPDFVKRDELADPYDIAVYDGYMEGLNRPPTQAELEAYRSIKTNSGAHAAIARHFGIPLPRGQLVPPRIFEQWVAREAGRHKPTEALAQGEKESELERKETASTQFAQVLLGELFNTLFPKPRTVKTLAARQLELAEEESKLRKYQLLSQLPFSLFQYGLSLGPQSQVAVEQGISNLANLAQRRV